MKDIICEVAAYAKVNFYGTDLPTVQLNNFITEIFLFYKGNLIIENISGNEQVFIATFYLDIIIIQAFCDHNNETIKPPYTRYDVYFH